MPSNSEMIVRWNQDLINLDSPKLKQTINPLLLRFMQGNSIQFYYVENLPNYLKQLQTCVVKINNKVHILLLNSELKLVADAVKIPLKMMADIALLHEISHLIADIQNKNHSEKLVWDIGFTFIAAFGVDSYTYYRVRNYLLGERYVNQH